MTNINVKGPHEFLSAARLERKFFNCLFAMQMKTIQGSRKTTPEMALHVTQPKVSSWSRQKSACLIKSETHISPLERAFTGRHRKRFFMCRLLIFMIFLLLPPRPKLDRSQFILWRDFFPPLLSNVHLWTIDQCCKRWGIFSRKGGNYFPAISQSASNKSIEH